MVGVGCTVCVNVVIDSNTVVVIKFAYIYRCAVGKAQLLEVEGAICSVNRDNKGLHIAGIILQCDLGIIVPRIIVLDVKANTFFPKVTVAKRFCLGIIKVGECQAVFNSLLYGLGVTMLRCERRAIEMILNRIYRTSMRHIYSDRPRGNKRVGVVLLLGKRTGGGFRRFKFLAGDRDYLIGIELAVSLTVFDRVLHRCSGIRNRARILELILLSVIALLEGVGKARLSFFGRNGFFERIIQSSVIFLRYK